MLQLLPSCSTQWECPPTDSGRSTGCDDGGTTGHRRRPGERGGREGGGGKEGGSGEGESGFGGGGGARGGRRGGQGRGGGVGKAREGDREKDNGV